jgi:Ser/Thr protein kinase RdoA (MazF antagonist)
LEKTNNTPYANLSPTVILDAIDSTGVKTNGSLLALNSYENRVYQVGIEDDVPLIAKFYRPNRWTDAAILEEHQFSNELLQLEIPVVAPLTIQDKTLHHVKEFRFALFPRKGGRTIALDNLDHLEWMGRFLGRFHAVGASKKFQHRERLDVQNYGYKPYRFLLANQFIPTSLEPQFKSVFAAVLEKAEACFSHLQSIPYLRLHGDCHVGNILWNDNGPQIVDLDDCLNGPAIQDIWMLLTGDETYEKNQQLDHILSGYTEFYDFDYRELHLIEALRALRMIRYAAWLAQRWEDPAFPLNFPWFNTFSYWKELIEHVHDQAILLDEAVLNIF